LKFSVEYGSPDRKRDESREDANHVLTSVEGHAEVSQVPLVPLFVKGGRKGDLNFFALLASWREQRKGKN
jgi:hypothetical protein